MLDPVCQFLHPGSKGKKKKTAQFFSHEQTIGLITYLWMSSFCVPNTDSEVFRSSHKFVFSNLHMFTSHLARITTHTIETLLRRGYTHLHTIERSGHNTIHKQPMSYVSLKTGKPRCYNKSPRTCFGSHQLCWGWS